jgi:PTH2 family peptidyl-tRNA hydrolase
MADKEEWTVPVDNSEDKSKMVIVVRKDLKMPRGKIAAQASHAAVGAVIQSIFGERLDKSSFGIDGEGFEITKPTFVNDATKDWLVGEFTKICVCVESEEELMKIYDEAEESGINVCLITDNGHTCFNGVPTKTCLAIGPTYSSIVDPITKDLKLYN